MKIVLKSSRCAEVMPVHTPVPWPMPVPVPVPPRQVVGNRMSRLCDVVRNGMGRVGDVVDDTY